MLWLRKGGIFGYLVATSSAFRGVTLRVQANSDMSNRILREISGRREGERHGWICKTFDSFHQYATDRDSLLTSLFLPMGSWVECLNSAYFCVNLSEEQLNNSGTIVDGPKADDMSNSLV